MSIVRSISALSASIFFATISAVAWAQKIDPAFRDQSQSSGPSTATTVQGAGGFAEFLAANGLVLTVMIMGGYVIVTRRFPSIKTVIYLGVGMWVLANFQSFAAWAHLQ